MASSRTHWSFGVKMFDWTGSRSIGPSEVGRTRKFCTVAVRP